MYLLVYIFAFFAVVSFFNYHQMVSEQMMKIMFYGISIIAMILAITDRRVNISTLNFPRCDYITLMVMIVLSPVMALIFHGQSLSEGYVTVLSMFFGYAWFYFLLKFNIPTKKVLAVMMAGCLLSIPVFIMNVKTAPGAMFGEEPSEALARGVEFRIYVVFIELFPLMLFLGIEKFKQSITTKRKTIWLLVTLVSAIMIVACVIRQIIAVSFLLAFILAVWGISWRKKLLTTLVLTIAAIIIVPRISIFKSLGELSEAQSELKKAKNDGEDIRIQAWRFYTYQFQDNLGAMIFGNGIPALEKSRYGIDYKLATDASACFEGDVGWAGFFFYFGLIGTVALALFLGKTCLKCNNPRQRYLAAWFAFIIITGVASGPILYTYQVFNLSSVLYLAYARPRIKSHSDCNS